MMQSVADELAAVSPGACAHLWVLDLRGSAAVRGRCKLCGVERFFEGNKDPRANRP
jgi:hypothetical protein